MRPASLVLLGLAAGLASAGCRPPAGGVPEVVLVWTVAPSPPRTGPARFSLALTDTKTGRPVQGAGVGLEGNMSHPGMQPVFAAAREVSPGRYEAALDLTMAGDWIVLVDVTLRDGRTLERQVELRGVGGREQ